MFLETLNAIFSTFGAAIFVPVVLFIISLILKVKLKKAFQVAVLAGIGLTGFNMLIGAFIPLIVPVVQSMVDTTGVQLPILDIGWQTTSIVGYSTEIGMIFIGLAILIQTVLFLTKWTDIFMPGDLWNNYSFMVWGSMIYIVTKSIPLAIGVMVVQNLYILLFAEVLEKRWSTYYNYPNCAMTAPHHIGGVPFALILNIAMNKLGFYKVKISAESLQEKLGFLGEPMTLGLILGMGLGIIGNLGNLGTLGAWGQIATVGISTAAVMTIFPKVAGIFASAFGPITEATKKSAKKNGKTRKWYLAVNDAVGYGEPNTLITGIILIPIIVLIAVILPGNKTLPMVDLIALPFMIEVIISMSNGNVFKGIVGGAVYFAIGLLICTATAPIFTDVAASVNVTIPAVGLMVTSFGILSNPTMGLIFLAFLTKNPLFIGLTIVLYFGAYFFFRKNKEKVHAYIEYQAHYGEDIDNGMTEEQAM